MRLTSQRAAWPLHLAQASRWVGTGLGAQDGAWALAGDAAHAVHPLAGQGLNLGLGDAAELAQVLAGKEYFRSYGDMRLLRRYERARKGDAAALRVATDGLQRLFALDDERARSLRNWGMRSFEALSPLKSAVMRRAMGV
jgi:2-polyprenyl-6-methoxyphenol hydroxylase-like FAD-dependent oxidoreductase